VVRVRFLMTNTSFLPVAFLGISLLTSCTSGRSRELVPTDAATSDGSVSIDAGVVFSANCPSSPVFDHQTCTGSTEGAICAGMQFCDSCSMNVATSCTCMPYTAGFEFRCADPCSSCAAGADAGTDSGTDAGPSGRACLWFAGIRIYCLESGESVSEATVASQCAEVEGTQGESCGGEGGGWIGTCAGYDDADATMWFYESELVDDAMRECALHSGTWMAL
jgi:hypothetical protein